MGRKLLYSCTVMIITAFLSCPANAGAAEAGFDTEDKIADGVFIENMDMSGKTCGQALAEIESYVEELSEKMIHCRHSEYEMDISLKDAGLNADGETAVLQAAGVGRGDGLFARIKEKWDAKRDGVYISLHLTCDRGLLEELLNSRASEVHREPKEASIIRQGGQFIIEESQNGTALNTLQMTDAIVDAVENDWNREDITIDLIVDEAVPKHTTEELSVIQDLLGSYETSFAGSKNNRINNIQNGAAKLENYVLYPGEEFSFLSLMVPFTAENGYKKAGTYVEGKNVDGMGGGICQVSSTLYNAVLRAELTVTQRSNHMMTVGYVPLGADATIANPNVDFKFKNETETPILIEAYTSGTSLFVNIYGQETRPPERSVSFVTVTEQTILPGADVITYDASKPPSYRVVTQNAHTGYVAAFYKNVYVNEQLVEQTLVNRSRYGAYPAYVTQGSGGVR